MGARLPTGYTNAPLTGVLVTTNETLIATTAPISPTFDGQPLLLIATFGVTLGTAAVAIQGNFRRGPALTSTLIFGPLQTNGVAGGVFPVTMMWIDVLSALASVQYSLTLQQVSATGNGAVSSVVFAVLAL